MPGTLFIVATPLGNLDDVSTRALRTLKSVRHVACEDTRRTARLLNRFGIARRTVSCHRFNEAERLRPILELLHGGHDVALVSDGGTPGISDPGARLVRAALEADIPVSPVPGPTAVAALLSASGMPADRFLFDGFLPHRAGERRRRLRELRSLTVTVVVFEAPHRIRRALADMEAILQDRPLVLGRELTKLHETIVRGSARQLLTALGQAAVRGEITLAIAPAGADAGRSEEPEVGRLLDAWRAALEESRGDRREALRRCARAFGVKRAELYRRLAELGEAD